jgi:hypothetical protein
LLLTRSWLVRTLHFGDFEDFGLRPAGANEARGTWSREEYRVTEITRVNFGGDYEDALHWVGGDQVEASGG